MSWTEVPDPVLQPPVLNMPPVTLRPAAENPSQMVVTWSTGENVGSEVYYGETRPETRALGNATRFVDGGVLKRPQYIHRATMAHLKPNTTYGECHISTASVGEPPISVCEYHISQSLPHQSVSVRVCLPLSVFYERMGNWGHCELIGTFIFVFITLMRVSLY